MLGEGGLLSNIFVGLMTAQFLVNILSGQSNKDFGKSNKQLHRFVKTSSENRSEKNEAEGVEKGR